MLITDLPSEMMFAICDYCDPVSIVRLMRTNRKLHSNIADNDSYIWRDIVRKRWGINATTGYRRMIKWVLAARGDKIKRYTAKKWYKGFGLKFDRDFPTTEDMVRILVLRNVTNLDLFYNLYILRQCNKLYQMQCREHANLKRERVLRNALLTRGLIPTIEDHSFIKKFINGDSGFPLSVTVHTLNLTHTAIIHGYAKDRSEILSALDDYVDALNSYHYEKKFKPIKFCTCSRPIFAQSDVVKRVSRSAEESV